MDGDLPKAHVDIFHGWTHLIYAPNVWLHNSVGRTLHGYFEDFAGSNPVKATIFSGCLLSNCLKWKIYCLDYSSLSSTTAVQIWIILCIVRIILLLAERSELNKLTSLPICGVIAHLVEHRTGISREVTGSNPVKALISQSGFFPIVHFTVVWLVTWPMTASEAVRYLVLIQTSAFLM